MQMELVAWCVAAALLAGVVVYFVLAGARRTVEAELAAAKSGEAVAKSQAEGLAADLAAARDAERKLAADKVTLTGEREALRTSFGKAEKDLESAVEKATKLNGDLEAAVAKLSRLESDYRVAKQRADDLAAEATDLKSRLQTAEADNRGLMSQVAQLGARISALETERDGLNTRLAEQKTWIEEQTRAFEERITNVTGQLLEDKSKKFTEVNKQEMDAVVAPFKEQLKDFRDRVDHIYSEDTKDRGQLQEKIRQLTELNQLVSKQAEDLTNALTISSKATGDWGEMILRKILEDSGLREGHEYILQQSVEGAEEDLQRPDAVINLPDGKQVVVDSKVSNKAWTEFCAATDEEERAAKLDAHLASLRAHIRGLSARDYQHSPDLKTVDFVLMFVPVEAAYLKALEADDLLFAEAWRSRIYLVSPGSLMASLRLIEGMWSYQRRKESADKIAEAGRKLYDKLTIFAATFLDVGTAIDKAHATFDKAQGQLATGKGNAIRLAEKMKKLGVTPGAGKVMPGQLVELADGEDEDDEPVALPAPDGHSGQEGTAAT